MLKKEWKDVSKDDIEILVSEMEHHANLIPWQQLAKRTGAELAWFEVTSEGRLDLSNIETVITSNTALVAITHQSNVMTTQTQTQEATSPVITNHHNTIRLFRAASGRSRSSGGMSVSSERVPRSSR